MKEVWISSEIPKGRPAGTGDPPGAQLRLIIHAPLTLQSSQKFQVMNYDSVIAAAAHCGVVAVKESSSSYSADLRCELRGLQCQAPAASMRMLGSCVAELPQHQCVCKKLSRHRVPVSMDLAQR